MSARSHVVSAALSPLILAGLIACGVPEAEPVATIRGELSASSASSTQSAVMLAMGWYAKFGYTPAGVPKAILTGRATYEGDFPREFTFELRGPPPKEALADLSAEGGAGTMAFGVLIAFEDRNDNGALDEATAAAASPDRVAGVSIADPSLPPPLHHYYVAYLDGTVPPDSYHAPFRLEQGYNLIEIHSSFGVQKVPLDRAISIPLTNTDAIWIFACEDVDFTGGYRRACGIDPIGGKYRLTGNMFVIDGDFSRQFAQFFVDTADGNISNAVITLNGAPVPFEPEGQYYYGAPKIGVNHLEVTVPGFPTEYLEATIPAPVTLAAPLPDTLPSGSSLPIAWNASEGTELYDLYFIARPDVQWLHHELTTATSTSTRRINYVGEARLSIHALGPLGVGSEGHSWVTPVGTRGQNITFTAP